MQLRERVNEDVKLAMKARETERLGTLRLLTAAMKQREVDERITLDDAGVVAVIEKMLKQRKDSVGQYEKAGRQDLADVEKREMAILQAYLPQQLTEAEVAAIVAEAVAATGAAGALGHGQGDGDREAEARRPRGHGPRVGAGEGEAGRLNRRKAGVPARPREDNPHGDRDRPTRMIPQDFIQALLGRVDIVDVIDRHVRLKKAGTNYKACCPFHDEKTPSFNVSPSKQFYHCFGCGAHGNAIGFVMEYSGLTYPDAIRELAQQVGMEVPEVRSRLAGPARGRAGQGPHRPDDGSAQLLPRGAQEDAGGDRVPQAPRAVRGDRGALRPGLRARRLAVAQGGVRRLRGGRDEGHRPRHRLGAGRGARGRAGEEGAALRPLPRARDVSRSSTPAAT